MASDATCTIPGCGRPVRAKGWCPAHYVKAQRNDGDPLASSVLTGTLTERVFSAVEFSDKWHDGTRCLEWQRAKTRAGYGVIRMDGVMYLLHRWMWEHCFGPVPTGYQIDHLCMNKACCNPAHLEAVTPMENTRRFRQAVADGRVPDPNPLRRKPRRKRRKRSAGGGT